MASGVSEGIQKLGRLWLEVAAEPGEDPAEMWSVLPFSFPFFCSKKMIKGLLDTAYSLLLYFAFPAAFFTLCALSSMSFLSFHFLVLQWLNLFRSLLPSPCQANPIENLWNDLKIALHQLNPSDWSNFALKNGLKRVKTKTKPGSKQTSD